MQQKLIKVISVLLVTAILYANSAVVISYAADNFLSEKELENQVTSTNNKNVEFDVYYDEGKHTETLDVNSTTKLNVKLKVKEAGYLKDVAVDFSDSNFKISDDGTNAETVETFDEVNKKITFNQINAENEIIKSLNISADNGERVSEDMFNKDNNIKLTATYVDKDAKEIKIEKAIVVHTGWKAENAAAVLEHELTKYIPYEINETKKVIVQEKIISKVENDVLPIKETNIEITAPKINEEYPENVIVIANSTASTNGNTSEITFSYENTTGKVLINAKNPSTEGKISWVKNSTDEYLVTYIYSEEAYAAVKDTKVKITYEASSVISLYNGGTGIANVKHSINGYEEKTEKLGDVIDFEVTSTKELYKGYMYNNLVASENEQKETEYTVSYTSNISYSEIVDGITLKIEEDTLDEKTNNNETYIKTLKIRKSEFDKILEENGQIVIKENTDATVRNTLETITAANSVEDEYITVDMSKHNVKSLIIETSKPQSAGNIMFELTKAIAKNLGNNYTESKIKNINNITTNAATSANNETTNIASKQLTSTIELKEPTQKASITTNKDTLSTILTNQDVEIKVTLENDSIDDVMYNQPTIKIKLPSNIENIDIKDVVTYFDNELSVESKELINNEDGTKTIVVKINGKQTKYNNAAAKGATIVVTADITLKKLTPTTDKTIEVEVENGNAEKTKTSAETGIKYVAPTGLVVTNTMTGHNGDESVEAISGDTKVALVSTKAEQKEVTYKMNVINNYANTLDNVVILGRTPFTGNKDILTSQDLGTTVNLPLSSGITVENIDQANVVIYYSENGEATIDLSNTSNNWVTTVTDYSTVKSYMIVLKDYTMNTGSMFNFGYKATIPANMEYEQSAYQKYAVFFNNNQPSGTIQDKVSAVAVGITTGTTAKLEATLTSETPDGTEVKGGTLLKYTLKVENKGAKDAENVVASIVLPNGVDYVVDENETENSYQLESDDEANIILKLNLGNIKAISSTEKTITLRTINSASAEPEIAIKATVIDNNGISATTNTITNKLAKTYFNVNLIAKVENHDYIMEGDIYSYILEIRSSEAYSLETNEKITRENTTITVNLPEELEYDSITLLEYSSELKDFADISSTAKVSTNGKTVSVNIGSVDGNYGKTLKIKSKIGKLPDGVYQKEIVTTGTIQADNTDVETIEEAKNTINKPAIKITQTSNIPEDTTITAGEDFIYTFTLENLSDTILENIKFVDNLPEEVNFKLAEVTYPDGKVSKYKKVDENGKPIIETYLKQKESLTINVKVSAKSIKDDTKITNSANVSNEYVKTESNKITHNIKKFVNTDIDIDPDTGEEKKTKKIIGTIWIDSNKDGIKDVNEAKVSGVTVLLLDNKTGDIAIDATGNKAIVKTTSTGAYMFNYLNPGKYTVIFLYDSANYSATTYQKEGVDSSKNSDAIDKEIVYEGIKRIAGVTEEITVSEENKYDVDLGIVENAKFDLKLDKTVESITVNNGKNVQKHEYNKNIAKIDFEAKYAESSTMIVEYKFTITNEGAIPGYVKKLADYLPEELKFSSELNTEWYQGKDGTIYNSSLANTIINPGESKEVKLLLTKNMSKESFGLITNNAEIYEASNDFGLEDMDSTPGNKVTNEDDYSTANVITTVKTGEAVIYATLTITVITILGVGIYLIKKKVIK